MMIVSELPFPVCLWLHCFVQLKLKPWSVLPQSGVLTEQLPAGPTVRGETWGRFNGEHTASKSMKITQTSIFYNIWSTALVKHYILLRCFVEKALRNKRFHFSVVDTAKMYYTEALNKSHPILCAQFIIVWGERPEQKEYYYKYF